TWRKSNIDIDPSFSFVDDYHLRADSPCIDAASNNPPGGLPNTDIDGNPRLKDGNGDQVSIADMGAYEYNPQVSSIAVSPSEMDFFVNEGAISTTQQMLSISNGGGGTLHWEVSENCPWLEISPQSGDCSDEVDQVAVSVNGSGLHHGVHTGEFQVSDYQAVNTPRKVLVTLYVNKTLHVPSDYGTIQAAINASVNGDTVLVADGTYRGTGNRDLDFGGKAITVCSENGSDHTIIDCEQAGRGFYFHSLEHLSSVVKGFTITNGYASFGGGGIYCRTNSNPMIVDCTIIHNSHDGIYISSANPTIIGCRILGNSTNGQGGGIKCGMSSSKITNCLFAGNSAARSGGGIYCTSYGNPTITNCTFVGNSASTYGGAIHSYDKCNVAVTNCIMWANTAPEGPEVALTRFTNSPVVKIAYSDVQGGPTAIYVGQDCIFEWQNSNIDTDPKFIDYDGPDNNPVTWEDNDYRLSNDSPCINTGDNSAVPSDITTDLDGNLRIVKGTVDMGAYERQNVLPVCDVNGPYTAECQGSATTISLDATNSSDPDNDPITYLWSTDCPGGSFDDPAGPTPNLTVDSSSGCSIECTVTLTVTDIDGASDSCSTTVKIADTTPPVIELIGDETITLECHADVYNEPGAAISDSCDTDTIEPVIGGDTVDVNMPGQYVITYNATDNCGNAAEQVIRTVIVEDTESPNVTVGGMLEIWPPNHQYHTFYLSDLVVSVEDGCQGDLNVDDAGTIISISSDEPDNAPGDGGNTTDDIVILGPASFRVRAERQGEGNGRVYTIIFEVADSAGNRTEQTAYIGVPHNQSPVDDGAAPGYTVMYTGDENIPPQLIGDVNLDATVNIFDLGMVKQNLFKPITSGNRDCDVNGDGIINILDMGVVKSGLFKSGP
ncbi:MAG: right-handed parallel beta-helix repeat-containing protein, partial [Planctomycetota bacterium]